jgi:hypothetical protein
MHVERGPTISRGVETLMTVGDAQPRTYIVVELAGLGALAYAFHGMMQSSPAGDRQANRGLLAAGAMLLGVILHKRFT